MMNPGQELLLEDVLRRLRLPAMVRQYREHARQAREAGESYEAFLLALASQELDQRQTNQVQRRLTEARFPVLKTLEKTDLKKWPGLDATQLREYMECHYITKRENIVILGKHGTGKSHAATVLGCRSMPAWISCVVHNGGSDGQHVDRSSRRTTTEAIPGKAIQG
jgi:DNA replication protein DnaC